MEPFFPHLALWLVEQVQARVNQHGYASLEQENKQSHSRCSELQGNNISNLHLLQKMPSATPYTSYPGMDWISHCYLCIMLNDAHHMEAQYILSNCTFNDSIRWQISVQQQWAAAAPESECTNQQTLFWRGTIDCIFTLNLETHGPPCLSIFIICNVFFVHNIPKFKKCL